MGAAGSVVNRQYFDDWMKLEGKAAELAMLKSTLPSPHTLAGTKLSCQDVPWVDVIIFGHEVDMLRYRLKVHEPLFSAVIVVESNTTHGDGRPKPLYAREMLTAEELRRYRITLLTAPIHDVKPLRKARDGSKHPGMAREQAQRKFVNGWMAMHFPKHRIFMSDVDELFDPDMACKVPHLPCVTPSFRMYLYSTHCAMMSATPWQMAVFMRTDSNVFLKYVFSRMMSMRGVQFYWSPTYAAKCTTMKNGYQGWHMSVFTNNSGILHKYRDICHSDMPEVKKLLALPPAEQETVLNERAAQCKSPLAQKTKRDPTTDKHDVRITVEPAFDGKEPPVPGWPRHPYAPGPKKQA